MSHTTGPQSDETPTSARPHRPTSTEPVDSQPCRDCGWPGLHVCHADWLRLINLAQSHAREADRLADNSRDAGTIHARLAQFWLDLAKEQRP